MAEVGGLIVGYLGSVVVESEADGGLGLHVLFFIDLHSRRVLVGGVTGDATNVRWCTQIARNLSEARESRSTPLRFLVHDRDHRFGEPFDEVFKAEGVGAIQLPAHSRIDAARWAFPTNHSEPRLTIFVKDACVFCEARIRRFCTTCTTSKS